MQRLSLLNNHVAENQQTLWVMKNVETFDFKPSGSNLKGKTIFITGGSRGIGLAIALRAAKDGANIAIAAKTTVPHPKLEGTIHSAAEEIRKAGGQCLPIQCDIRDEKSVQEAVALTVKTFGGIDILINNASALYLSSVEETTMKQYDLAMSINARGTFMVSKYCIPPPEVLQEPPHPDNLPTPLCSDRPQLKLVRPHRSRLRLRQVRHDPRDSWSR